jgi:hypothetical protein
LLPIYVQLTVCEDFYEVIALGEPLDPKLLSSKATREQVADAIVGKVLGWGMWVGSYERVWK